MKKEYIVLEEIEFFYEDSNSGMFIPEERIIKLEFNEETNIWYYEDYDGYIYWQNNYSIEDKIEEITNKHKEQRILDKVRGYTKDWEEGIITNEEYIKLINKQMNDVQSLNEENNIQKLKLSPAATKTFNQFHDYFTENFHIEQDEMEKILNWYLDWNKERKQESDDIQTIINIGQYAKSRNSREE